MHDDLFTYTEDIVAHCPAVLLVRAVVEHTGATDGAVEQSVHAAALLWLDLDCVFLMHWSD